jgi:hypothetical protein
MTLVTSSPGSPGWKPMIDERSVRRPTFMEGTRIRLADAQEWSFPDHPPYKDDPRHIALLRALGEAEDRCDRLRTELALTIHLLTRNYDLTSADYRDLLEFEPGDPALGEMQRAIGKLADAQYRGMQRLSEMSPDSPLLRSTHWLLGRLLRRKSAVNSARSFWLN